MPSVLVRVVRGVGQAFSDELCHFPFGGGEAVPAMGEPNGLRWSGRLALTIAAATTTSAPAPSRATR
jgi:hypothetical protein